MHHFTLCKYAELTGWHLGSLAICLNWHSICIRSGQFQSFGLCRLEKFTAPNFWLQKNNNTKTSKDRKSYQASTIYFKQISSFSVCIQLFVNQWFQSLFMCKSATLNFSMEFNITAPYMDCVTHKQTPLTYSVTPVHSVVCFGFWGIMKWLHLVQRGMPQIEHFPDAQNYLCVTQSI